MSRWFIVLTFAFFHLLAITGAQAQTSDLPPEEAAKELGISLPSEILHRPVIARELLALSREQCDRQAISKLSGELEKESYRREAAKILVSFSDGCGGYDNGLRQAINLLLDISDYAQAADLAGKLIEMQPNDDNGYYLRAVALEKSNQCERAIADYSSAIELFGNKDKISSVGYQSMSRCYEQLGQYCDAMVPIESWVALDPAGHDNDQTASILRRLAEKGKCSLQNKGKKEERIRRKGSNVITVEAEIDGVKGTFIIDTGASYVTVKKAFAEKAGIKMSGGQKIRLNTANGAVDGYLTRAGSVKLRSLESRKVQVVVQADGNSDYGDGVSGLIGMSFLSRFEIVMDSKNLRIRPRK